MLRYLNQIDFSPFGRIVKDEHRTGGKTEHITSQYVDIFYQYDKAVYLNIISGLCALCLRTDDGVHTFLLDKPVILNPGICFALASVESFCEVKIITNDEKRRIVYADRSFIPSRRTPQIVINDIISFFYQECEFGLRSSAESHSFFELTYVDSGKVINIVDGKSYSVNQGELILFFPGQAHMQKCEPGTASSFLTVSFDMNLVGADFLKNRVFKADAIIRGIYSNILSEYQIFDEYSPDMLAGYLHHILLHLMRYSTGHTTTSLFAPEPNEAALAMQIRSSTTNRLVKNAIDYIDTHIEKKLSLSDVAKVLNLNPAYMSRLFKEHTGICITDYIKTQKLGKSKKLLKSGGYTVTEISEMFSFSSIHYFSNCFKKEFGVSPGDYANMLHN